MVADPRADEMLDCRGLLCPIPALETRKALETLAPGSILEVTCTDRASIIDIAALCDETGDRLLGRTEHASEIVFRIQKRDVKLKPTTGVG